MSGQNDGHTHAKGYQWEGGISSNITTFESIESAYSAVHSNTTKQKKLFLTLTLSILLSLIIALHRRYG